MVTQFKFSAKVQKFHVDHTNEIVTNNSNITDLYKKIEEIITSWVENKTEIAWNKNDSIISEIHTELKGFQSIYQFNIIRSIVETHRKRFIG